MTIDRPTQSSGRQIMAFPLLPIVVEEEGAHERHFTV